jgi:hypothetical protein
MRAPRADGSTARGSYIGWLVGAVTAFLVAVAMAGCGRSKCVNCESPPPLPFEYPALDTPQHVVLNVKYAWERRDSVRTRELYDDTYQGTSTDPDGTLNFSKNQEVAAVWAIGKSQDVLSVSFTLRPETTWLRLSYPTDPAGWTAIQLQGVNILVDDVTKGTLVASSSSFFEFKFKPTLDAASPTDTTWKIVRWTEIKN